MQFEVGACVYQVKRQYGLKLEGNVVMAYVDHQKLLIMLSGELTADEAADSLRHEHYHAWEWRAGATRIFGEDRAQFAALVGRTFERDFGAGGGLAGLEALPIAGCPADERPIRAVPAISSQTMDWRCCGGCQTPIAAGSIATGSVIELSAGSWVVDRWMVCPACDCVTCWRERADAQGTPSGGIVAAKLLRDRELSEWMSEHENELPPAHFNFA